jgi:hypothetical protein
VATVTPLRAGVHVAALPGPDQRSVPKQRRLLPRVRGGDAGHGGVVVMLRPGGGLVETGAMYRVILVIACAGACTFQPDSLLAPVDRDAAPGTPDARPDAPVDAGLDTGVVVPPDAAEPDAGPVPCDFMALIEGDLVAAPVDEVNTPELDRDPFITADGATMFLMSGRPGGQSDDIWAATRAGRGADFSTPSNVAALNSPQADTRVSLTADQRIAVLSSARGNGFDVYVSERAIGTQDFPAPRRLDSVSTGSDEFDPVLSLDGLRLYLSGPGRNPGDRRDILLASRGDRSDDFSTPVPLGAVNSNADEADPAFTADERVILFARNNDIFYATRATTADDFSAPRPLTAINTSFEEADPFVTADGCELFFSSTRDGGDFDIYRVLLEP